MTSKGKLQANIQRLKDQKTSNLSKMDSASTHTETEHYRMLAQKNQRMIAHYIERLKEVG